MKLQEAIDSGKPFRWENWPAWYRWDTARGVFAADPDLNPATTSIYTVPTHQAIGDRWETCDVRQETTWYRPSLMWHRTARYYRESRNWYPNKDVAEAAYTRDYVIAEWEERLLPKRYA